MAEQSDTAEPVSEAPPVEVATVAKSVLTAYFDSLAGTDGFADIAPKLRALVLDEGAFSEAAIKAVMFSDIP